MTITTLTVFFAFFTLVSSTALIGASSIIIGEKTIGTKFPYHVYVPHLLPHYIELFSFALAVTWNGLIIVVHDSLYISLMNHVCCQVEVLRISLQNIQIDRYPQPPIDEIKYCVKHHQLISTLRNRIEAIFSEMLLLQFLTSLLIFGMAGFQATVNNSIGNAQQITMYAYCCCILFELFVYCWFSNQVINQVKFISHDRSRQLYYPSISHLSFSSESNNNIQWFFELMVSLRSQIQHELDNIADEGTTEH